MRLMATGDDFTGPVNIGNPGEFTMLELAERVIALTGSKSKIVKQPLPSDDPMQRQPDIDPCPLQAALGADDATGRRPEEDHRLFRDDRRTRLGCRPRHLQPDMSFAQ